MSATEPRVATYLVIRRRLTAIIHDELPAAMETFGLDVPEDLLVTDEDDLLPQSFGNAVIIYDTTTGRGDQTNLRVDGRFNHLILVTRFATTEREGSDLAKQTAAAVCTVLRQHMGESPYWVSLFIRDDQPHASGQNESGNLWAHAVPIPVVIERRVSISDAGHPDI